MRLFKCTIGLVLFWTALVAIAQPFEEGKHYQRIDVPIAGLDDRVEVIDAFAYPCGACRNFLPHIAAWEAELPDYVDLQRRPVPLQQGWELFVLGYYTAKVMGLPESEVHPAIFRAVHEERRRFGNLADLAEVYAEYGDFSVDTFVNTAQSFAVDAAVRKNSIDLDRFGIRQTPTVIVQGKWRVSPRGFNSYEEMLAAINYLVEMEAAALGLGQVETAAPADQDVTDTANES